MKLWFIDAAHRSIARWTFCLKSFESESMRVSVRPQMDGNRRVAEDGARVNVRPAASGECCSLESRRPASFVGHRLMQTSNISKCLPLSIRFVEEIALNDVPPAHLVFSKFHFLTFSKNENFPFRCKWTRIRFRLMTRRPTLSVRAASNPFCSAFCVLNDVPPALVSPLDPPELKENSNQHRNWP